MENLLEDEGRICIFPAMGYWEMHGKPVSDKEAEYGLNPFAKWIPISHEKCCFRHLRYRAA